VRSDPAAPIVVDTMVASALINERRRPTQTDPFAKLTSGRAIVVSFVTVTELRFGALNGGWGELRRRSLERNLEDFRVVQPDDRLMTLCASLRAQLVAVGHPLGQKDHDADRWIAATAIAADLELVSDDRVFVGVPGLSLLSTRDA
jgi:predicted nucleic acid-binding protein